MQLKRSCFSSGRWRTGKEPPGLLRTTPAAEGWQGRIQSKSRTWCESLLGCFEHPRFHTCRLTVQGSIQEEVLCFQDCHFWLQGWKKLLLNDLRGILWSACKCKQCLWPCCSAVPLWCWNRLWESNGHFIHSYGTAVSEVSDVHKTPIHSTVLLCVHYR